MEMQDLYKQAMEINSMSDLGKKEAAAKKFFDELNHMELPEYFNWAAEIFEGIHVKERGDLPALIWADLETGADKQFTFKEFSENGNRLLNYMRKFGVKKDDNFYMMVPIVPETWFATFAAMKGGIVSVPTATTMTVRELEFRFEAYMPNVIIADEVSADIIDETLKTLGSEPKLKLVIGKKDGWKSYSEVANESAESEPAKTKVKDIILCFFTSGTTGLPKRVGHTEGSYPIGHLSTSIIIGVKPGDIHHNLSAPGWAKWAWSSFFGPFNVGAGVAAFNFKTLDPAKYIEFVSKYKVSTFCAPPTAWRAFINVDMDKYDISSLKQSISAGEPLNPEVINQWKKYTGTEIRDFYGQTESTAMIGNPPWMEGKMRAGSFGRPSFMYDAVLLDDSGQEITKPDEPGQIAIRLDRWRAMGLFAEYLGSPEKMADVFKGNYYYTGDRASFDKDGYWWFVGRADDVIKSSDYRVGPFEVESALVEHPAVGEAAVVGSPDPKRYQLVKAYVILNKGYEPSKELALDLFKHTIEVLAKFKIPRIIEFVNEVPKTISGKIRRIDLRDQEIKKKESNAGPSVNEYFYWDFPELSSKHKK